jgi:uncharacterized membrane protein YfhO
VDGRPTKILLADDAFKAVVVPKGSHSVRFEFSSARVYAGVGISLATVLLTAVFLIATRPRKGLGASAG